MVLGFDLKNQAISRSDCNAFLESDVERLVDGMDKLDRFKAEYEYWIVKNV